MDSIYIYIHTHTVRTEMITIKTPDRLKIVIVSVIFAKLILLGIPRCNCNQRVFHRNRYIFRESIRLGIQKCNCNCNHQKINSRKQNKLHVINFDDEGIYACRCSWCRVLGLFRCIEVSGRRAREK